MVDNAPDLNKSPCRVCKGDSAEYIGVISVSQGNSFPVFQCHKCGCRFVWREYQIHDELHAREKSPYSSHSSVADLVESLFHLKDHNKIHKILSKEPKYKFILDMLKEMPLSTRILEVGCSQGYLTAYYLCKGYSIIGVDISQHAVSIARHRFGDHFQVVNVENPNDIKQLSQFDVIFFVGTIGCVSDPIMFINNLLDHLKPDGILLFNSPDLQSIIESQKIWPDALPPDLITIFPEQFWERYFSLSADIEVSFEPYDHEKNLALFLSQMLTHGGEQEASLQSGRKTTVSSRWRWLSPFFFAVTYVTRWVLPRSKMQYGMYVKMVKKR
ncbi:MAG: class I SAM-dependent methyltransferase [Methanomicrobiales archaeon]|nr:class I SAM-dependent methyltransferase [Methanomicrobiales archaeon]